MHSILTSYPTTGFADRARLLVGQELNRKGSFKDARLLFSEFIDKAGNSSLLPEVKLALAQTYVQERNWPQAIDSFEKWIATFTNHALLPDAEFSRALATFQSGAETNALVLFTNFVTRFPSNNLAPVAQNWLGDFYFNHEDFVLAEQNYQLVLKYNPSIELNCQARMGAGRAAFERQGFKEARDYFSKLVSDATTPTNFLAEAYFALGDTIYSQFLADTNHPADDFRAAVSAFSTITREFSTNALAALAFGRIGECYFQWANLSKEESADAFASATNAFTQVLESAFADVSARSQAQVGLGKIFEVQGDIEAALEHYARVFYVNDGDSFDSRWVKEAGLAAARLCENREQWEQAVNIYQRLLAVLPSLKPSLEKKILIDRGRSETAKN
jgi:tetratricopeptide (TPR) repeat protein